MKSLNKSFALLVTSSLVLASMQPGLAATVVQPTVTTPSEAAPHPAQYSAAVLNQLVAPIALYPDVLVAQILAAATHPTGVVEADRWVQQHSGLLDVELAQAVDQQHWDPSVKALTQFPEILANMDKNLSWTSALGNAYATQPQSIFNAIQVMRRRAARAGTLYGGPQELVITEGSTIEIQPADPQLVYLPEYDPWLVYGDPISAYPDWYTDPDLYDEDPAVWFGLGVDVGVFGGYGWGWHHWRTDWHHGQLVYHDNPLVPHQPRFGDRNDVARRYAGTAPMDGVHVDMPHDPLGMHPGALPNVERGYVGEGYGLRTGANIAAGAHFGELGDGGFRGGEVPVGAFHGGEVPVGAFHGGGVPVGGFNGGFHAGGFHMGGFHMGGMIGGGFHGGGGGHR